MHKVHIQNLISGPPNPLYYHRPHGNIWDKVAVHNIDVDHGGTPCLALIQCVGKV